MRPLCYQQQLRPVPRNPRRLYSPQNKQKTNNQTNGPSRKTKFHSSKESGKSPRRGRHTHSTPYPALPIPGRKEARCRRKGKARVRSRKKKAAYQQNTTQTSVAGSCNPQTVEQSASPGHVATPATASYTLLEPKNSTDRRTNLRQKNHLMVRRREDPGRGWGERHRETAHCPRPSQYALFPSFLLWQQDPLPPRERKSVYTVAKETSCVRISLSALCLNASRKKGTGGKPEIHKHKAPPPKPYFNHQHEDTSPREPNKSGDNVERRRHRSARHTIHPNKGEIQNNGGMRQRSKTPRPRFTRPESMTPTIVSITPILQASYPLQLRPQPETFLENQETSS